jgi:hypothetical protein
MGKTILGALAVLVVLVAAYFFFAPEKYTSTSTGALSPGLEKLRDAKVDDVAKVVLEKGKGKVELAREGDGWVVASAHGYPADKEKVEKLLKTLDGIERGEKAGENPTSHPSFEVDRKKGGFITLLGKDGSEIAKIVVGKTAPGGGISMTRIFARFGDEDATWRIESDVRSEAMLYSKDAEAKSYLLKDIVKLADDMEIESVRLTRPEKPDLLVERRYKEVPVEKPAEPPPAEGETKDAEKKEEEKKPETKKEEYFVITSGTETVEVGKDEEWTARGLVNRGKTFSIDDAAEPKDLAEYGLDKPQLKVVYAYRKKDAADDPLKSVTILFGNAKKDGEGESKSYYALVDDPAHKGRIYLVESYKFDGWNKEMKDFLPKPKEEEKPKDAAPAGEIPGATTPPADTSPAPTAAPPPSPAEAPASGKTEPPPAAPAEGKESPPPAAAPLPGAAPATGPAVPPLDPPSPPPPPPSLPESPR